MTSPRLQRILVVDDNPAIHEDFRKILTPEVSAAPGLGAAAAALFGRAAPGPEQPRFELECASSGQEGLEHVRVAAESGRPFSMAYVDVRMPNGWDGIETISRIWREYPELQIVICTAFSDYSWEEIQARLGQSDRFLILKKPFDNVEVRQLTYALAKHARAASALRESEESFRGMVEAVKDYAIIMLDTEGLVTSWNAGAQRFVGYRAEEIVGQHFRRFYPEEAQESGAPAEALETARILGRFEDEGWRTRQDRTRFWAEVVLTALHEQTGVLRGFVIVLRDISERKRATEALRQAHEDLEARVLQRTRELAAAMTEANRANQAKSEFLSRTSHELRTPMNAILGFAQLLELEPSLGARPREHIAEILRGGHHLLGLINEVLDLSRIESGHLTLSLEAVAVRELAEETLSLLQPLGASFRVTLDPLAAGPELYVLADRQRLKQVLLNLLSNGIKYNRSGGHVGLDFATHEVGERHKVHVTVRDDGVGISPEKISRLFTPFDRLGAEQSHAHIEGSGLGLALSRAMVQLMGGALTVRSELARGSTFRIELPATVSGELVPALLPQVVLSEPGETPSLTMIYVEDNPSSVRLVQQIVSRRPQVRLLTAAEGHTGLQLIRQEQPGLVLLDLNLPDLDGEKILAQLQRDPATRAVPVIILSADATPGQTERLLAAGACRYLTKPIVIAQLLEIIDETAVGQGVTHL